MTNSNKEVEGDLVLVCSTNFLLYGHAWQGWLYWKIAWWVCHVFAYKMCRSNAQTECYFFSMECLTHECSGIGIYRSHWAPLITGKERNWLVWPWQLNGPNRSGGLNSSATANGHLPQNWPICLRFEPPTVLGCWSNKRSKISDFRWTK